MNAFRPFRLAEPGPPVVHDEPARAAAGRSTNPPQTTQRRAKRLLPCQGGVAR